VEDVAREDHEPALVGELPEEGDGLGARHGIETVERLVEDEDPRIVGQRLREADALAHPLAVGGHLAPRGIGQIGPLDRGGGPLLRLGARQAVQPQQGRHEAEAGHARGERVVLGAVPDRSEEPLGSSVPIPRTVTRPFVGRRRPVIRFMRVVLPEPFGPTRLVMPGPMDRLTRLTPSTSP